MYLKSLYGCRILFTLTSINAGRKNVNAFKIVFYKRNCKSCQNVTRKKTFAVTLQTYPNITIENHFLFVSVFVSMKHLC